MDIFPTEKVNIVLIIAGIAIWASVGIWAWVFLRRHDGPPVLPVKWRRPVPWRGFDLILFVVVYFLFSFFAIWVGNHFYETKSVASGTSVNQAEVASTPVETEKETSKKPSLEDSPSVKEKGHAVILVLRDADQWTIVLCFFVAVIFAPITEEIIFRMFIQGYLEKLDTRLRLQARRTQAFYHQRAGIEPRGSFFTFLPWGVMPILLTSGVFAMLHFRMASEPPPADDIRWMMILTTISGTILVVLLLLWLRFVRGARLSDFGIVGHEIPRDIFRGLVAFLAIAAPVYAVQITASVLVPENFAPDPISIFVLSIAFGTIWCRTHRLISSIVMHMAFNCLSLGMVVYALT